MRNPISELIVGFAANLRYPQLFMVIAGLFLIDLVVPDMVPFVDEILLGLGAMLLGSLKKRRGPAEPIDREEPTEARWEEVEGDRSP